MIRVDPCSVDIKSLFQSDLLFILIYKNILERIFNSQYGYMLEGFVMH